jgi:hypothetical protein
VPISAGYGDLDEFKVVGGGGDKIPAVEFPLDRVFDDLVIAMILAFRGKRTAPARTSP